jgi:hypothetical protein
MAQAVSSQPLTPEARFHARVSPCSTSGEQSGTEIVALRRLRFPVSITSPRLSILIYHLGNEQ